MSFRIPRPVLSLSGGHFLIDCYASMFGAFLPFLHQKLGLSLAEAGILGGVLSFSSAFMQPFYGYLADRLRKPVFTALGPGLAGLFISALGLAPNFWALVVMVILGGAGISAFHPQAASIVSESSGRRKGFHMSVFVTGGMLGYALGPVYITTVIALVGLGSSLWACVPGVAMSLYLVLYGPTPSRAPALHHRTLLSRLMEQRKPLLILYLLVVIRGSIQIIFVAFLPLYLTLHGYGAARAALVLSLFLLAGGSAGFLGGILSDRFGGKRILALSMVGSLPLLLAFLWSQGPISIVLCILGGGVLLSTSPVNVVMAQQMVPEATSTISALLMGFAWGVGGLLLPVVGFASQTAGLQLTMTAIVLFAMPGFVLALKLPPDLGKGGLTAAPRMAQE